MFNLILELSKPAKSDGMPVLESLSGRNLAPPPPPPKLFLGPQVYLWGQPAKQAAVK